MLKRILAVVLLSVASSDAAIVTKTIATCDDKKIRWEIDYDDVAMKVVKFRHINQTKSENNRADIYGVGRSSFLREQDKVANRESSKEVTISKTGTNQIPVTINSKGKLDGIEGQFECGE